MIGGLTRFSAVRIQVMDDFRRLDYRFRHERAAKRLDVRTGLEKAYDDTGFPEVLAARSRFFPYVWHGVEAEHVDAPVGEFHEGLRVVLFWVYPKVVRDRMASVIVAGGLGRLRLFSSASIPLRGAGVR